MFNGFYPRNCALIASIPSGIFSGDGTHLPGMGRQGADISNKGSAVISGDDGTKLVGYFSPNDTGTVVGSTYENLVTGQKDLAIYNGMSYNSGYVNGAGFHSDTSGTIFDGKPVPDHSLRFVRYFEADGVDDFLGPLEATNYGDQETGLHLNYAGSWSVCMWVNFSEQSWEGSGSDIFSCGPQGVMDWDGYVARMSQTGFNYDFSEQVGQTNSYSYIRPVEKDRWYFVSFENNGLTYLDDATEGFTIAVDGKVLPHATVGGPYSRQMKTDALYVGASYSTYQVDSDVFERNYSYARSGVKFGKIMVYSGDIGINRIIQNYVATREDYNRHSGEKNPYFVERAGKTFTY
jgi:hypothetical protein